MVVERIKKRWRKVVVVNTLEVGVLCTSFGVIYTSFSVQKKRVRE
jgi:hypothetical protein